jgi:hypothetical protein
VKEFLELNTLESKGFAKAHGRILLAHLEEFRRQGKLARYWRVNALAPYGFTGYLLGTSRHLSKT